MYDFTAVSKPPQRGGEYTLRDSISQSEFETYVNSLKLQDEKATEKTVVELEI